MKRTLLISALFLPGCTFGHLTTPDGLKATYLDFHPAGNAVVARGGWTGVGTVEINRNTQDSAEIVKSVTEGVTRALAPIP